MPATSAIHLRVDGISKSYPDQRVLTDVSFTASTGDCAGLIGENGSGKSTLLRIMGGVSEPDSGTVRVVGDSTGAPRIGLLRQEPPFTARMTLADAVESAVSFQRGIEAAFTRAAERLGDDAGAQLASDAGGHGAEGSVSNDAGGPVASDADEFSRLLDLAQLYDVWELDTHIDQMLAGLGLAGIPRDRPTGEMSGGEQTRLSLACTLLASPDVLLLDEPTNHLDDAAVEYLTGLLKSWRGPVVFASHDRAFLDDCASVLIDLDPSPVPHSVRKGADKAVGVTRYTGNYSDYLDAKRDERARWERQYESEQDELDRLRAGVRDNHQVGHSDWKPRTESRISKKFYGDRNAKVVSRRVNDSRSRLETLEEAQVAKPPRRLEFSGLAATGGSQSRFEESQTILAANDVAFEGRLTPTSVAVRGADRLLVTGHNGSGKSTLLSILSGRVEPTSGTVTYAPELTAGILTQQVDLGPADVTAREWYEKAMGEELAERVPLATFGLIHPRDLDRRVSTLSVGQRRRLMLAAVLADPPDLLLLDEPTNHFSLELVTELENSIPSYPGAVIVASHDRWMRQRWARAELELPAGVGLR